MACHDDIFIDIIIIIIYMAGMFFLHFILDMMQKVKMADEAEEVDSFGGQGTVTVDRADEENGDEEEEGEDDEEEEEEDEEEDEEEEDMYGEIVQCWQTLPLIWLLLISYRST